MEKLTKEELTMIQKYRAIDTRGKRLVDVLLDFQYELTNDYYKDKRKANIKVM